jgi:hypothetical protein
MASVLIVRTGMRLVPAVMARPKLSTDSIQPAWTSGPRQDRSGTLRTSRTRLARPAINPAGTTKRRQAIAPAPSSLAEILVKLVSDNQTAIVSFPVASGGRRTNPAWMRLRISVG